MRKEFLLNHLTVFLIAAAASLILIFHTSLRPYFINYDKGASSAVVPDTNRVFFANYDVGYRAEISVRNRIRNGNSIVVIGSSEMTHTDFKAIPYNFFNSNKIPCLGFGHEGNQSLAIMAQLAVFHKELKNSKIVIIVSPGWFEGNYAKGTSQESFLEFVDERLLYLLYFDSDIPKESKEYLYDYVAENFKNISAPSAILKLIYYTAESRKSFIHKIIFSPFCSFYQSYCEKKMKVMTDLFYQNKSMMPFTNEPYKTSDYRYSNPLKINWDSLKSSSIEEFKASSNNNLFGIENNYYNKWMKGGVKRNIKPVNENNNVEFNDFVNLLALLKSYNCKTLFVIQPLNPLVYNNMHAIDPTLARVVEEIKKNNFECLNLHTSDETKYVKGIMTDYQHLGNAGWYEVDEKVYNYFYKQ